VGGGGGGKTPFSCFFLLPNAPRGTQTLTGPGARKGGGDFSSSLSSSSPSRAGQKDDWFLFSPQRPPRTSFAGRHPPFPFLPRAQEEEELERSRPPLLFKLHPPGGKRPAFYRLSPPPFLPPLFSQKCLGGADGGTDPEGGASPPSIFLLFVGGSAPRQKTIFFSPPLGAGTSEFSPPFPLSPPPFLRTGPSAQDKNHRFR